MLEQLAIPNEFKGDFVLVKKSTQDAIETLLILAQNRERVSCTFGDYVVLSDDNANNNIPFNVYQIVGLFNSDTDYIARHIRERRLRDLLDELNVKYYGQVVKVNVTNPNNPMGANTGGNTATANGDGEGATESSPSTNNPSNNGNSDDSNESGSTRIRRGGRCVNIIIKKAPQDDKDKDGQKPSDNDNQEPNDTNSKPTSENPNRDRDEHGREGGKFGNDDELFDEEGKIIDGKHITFEKKPNK